MSRGTPKVVRELKTMQKRGLAKAKDNKTTEENGSKRKRERKWLGRRGGEGREPAEAVGRAPHADNKRKKRVRRSASRAKQPTLAKEAKKEGSGCTVWANQAE